MDRTEAAPLTSERRYGIYRTGLVAAALLIVVVAGAGIALLFGIRNATILLCILLPLLLLSAAIAHLFLWWQHRRAVHRRENAVGEWVPATVHRQQSIPSADSPRSSDSWFKRISSRASTRSTPPPGYHTVSTS
ncbi:uncharacterized protein LOC105703278 isoform X2 [Orussus abietinus]|uniref:uncharacterized protein LOC105703278 isoform X2 n=1 Tax=Orussus abietinus TaxID=222816 RepID=UPI000C71615C|nr:uncharacterized protein LOC105703278 isoform X2 [Orussus abietinus]